MPDVSTLTSYPSVDKPWMKYYSEEELNIPLPQMTLYQSIWQNNKAYLDDIAILYFGKKMTYRAMFAAVDQCALALKRSGVKRGDCVNLCTVGTPETIILVLACNKLGVLANFLNPLFTAEQMTARINDTGAHMLFVLDKVYGRVADALKDACIEQVVAIPVYQSMPQPIKTLAALKKGDARLANALKHDKSYRTWKDFLRLGEGAPAREYLELEAPYQKDTPAVMVYSSGTTGASKGIVLTNEGINATIAHSKNTSDKHKRGNTFLQMIPVWFSTGIVLSMMMPLTMGITVIPEPVFSKETFANDLAKYRPNMTLGATSLWRYAIHSPKLKNTDFSQMNFPMSGGEAIRKQDSEEIKQFLRDRGCTATFFVGYGMCELGSQVTSSTVAYEGKEGSAGIPILHARVAAFDIKTNQEMKYGERGEIRVDSPARMLEYYKNPAATEEYFYTDKEIVRWGRTGDIGYVDEDGDVFVLGRAADSYTADNGELVYNFDAEAAILRDDCVTTCKVLGVSSGGKTIPVAHIMLRDGVKDAFADVVKDLDRECRESLEEYAVPIAYKQRDAFPVHPNGKRDNQTLMQERDGFVTPRGEKFEF